MPTPPDLTRSLAMQQRAKQRIPGMTQLLSKRPDIFSLGVWPTYYQKAHGATTWDLDGNQYLDFSICGIGATILGFADPEVDEAVRQAIANGQACSLNSPAEVELAETLCDLHPWAHMARFARSGGEAMAIAVRIARAAAGKDKIAFCGYHGWHDWYLAANLHHDDALADHLLTGLSTAGVPKALTGTAIPFHFNDTAEFQRLLDRHGDDLGVIVMEVYRNAPPDPTFISTIRHAATSRGIVLIFDEISSAFRHNCGGIHLTCTDVTPDLAVFSKALGNGYAIGAVIGRQDVMQAAQTTFISSTTWTERIGPTAALATIRKFQRDRVHEHNCANGKRIAQAWQDLATKHHLHIHTGGMHACPHFAIDCPDFPAAKSYFVQLMLDRGFLASNLCYSMFAHTSDMIDRYLQAADEAFQLLAKAIAADNVHDQLRGQPAAPTFQRLT